MTATLLKEEKPYFMVDSDIEIIQRLERVDKLFQEWKMWFSTLEESYEKMCKKLNIKQW